MPHCGRNIGLTLWFHCVVSLCGMTMAHVWPILPFLQGLDTSLPRKLLQDLMDVLLVHGAAFNKIMIVQLMLNKWVFNGVMVGTPVRLHDAAQRGVHIKVAPESTESDFLDAFTILT